MVTHHSRRSFLKVAVAMAFMPALLIRRLKSGLAAATAARGWPYQLHIHAHSGHATPFAQNKRGRLASMRWFSAWSHDIGIDNLWWSDHDHSFHQDATFLQTFDPPVRVGTDGEPKFRLGAQTMPTDLDDAPGKPYGGRSWPPVYARPVVRLRYRRGELGAGNQIVIKLMLSWHPEERGPVRHRVEIRFGPKDTVPELVQPGLIRQQRRTPGGKGGLEELVIELDDQAFPGISLDNVVGTLQFVVKGTWLEIHELEVACRNGSAIEIWRARSELASGNAIAHGTSEFVGTEYSTAQGEISDPANRPDGRTHVNAFTAEPFLITDQRLPRVELAARIHAVGGLVSLNHPFGAAGFPLGNIDQSVERVQRFALHLLEQDAWAVDLIEIGYLVGRGGTTFDAHLLLWDLLAVNKNFLATPRVIGGLGVSDMHGFDTRALAQLYVTWLLAGDRPPARRQAVDLLRAHRMFFGRHAMPQDALGLAPTALLDFSIGDAASREPLVMGQEGVAPAADPTRTPLEIRLIAPGTAGNLRLQALDLVTGETPNLELVRSTTDMGPVDPSGTTIVSTSVNTESARFFRVELYSPAGRPLAFTNHILTLPNS